jgi:hypothetical protein
MGKRAKKAANQKPSRPSIVSPEVSPVFPFPVCSDTHFRSWVTTTSFRSHFSKGWTGSESTERKISALKKIYNLVGNCDIRLGTNYSVLNEMKQNE